MIRNIENTQLTNKQKHTLEYWRITTNEIENTCLSVLHLLYQEDDFENYLKYQCQFSKFKEIRNVLFDIVFRTVKTNNLFLMESVVVDAVKLLMKVIELTPSANENFIPFERNVCHSYDEIALIIIECMSILKSKLQDMGLFST